MLQRLAVLAVPVVLVIGLLPAPAQAQVSTTYATFQGWVRADKRGGATYDPHPFDPIPLTGTCIAMGTHGVTHLCQLEWSLRYTTRNICQTGADAGLVGVAIYSVGSIPAVTFDLYGAGVPGATALEGFLVLQGAYVGHVRIDASDACAATTAADTAIDATREHVAITSPGTTDPYENALPNAFEGTIKYVG